jgi:beta-galactosidase
MFTVLCAMAYGVRGFNVYMAVERDRWLGSPIDRDGVLRPFSAFWRKLGVAYDRVDFGALVRDTPARLVVPRSMRRLARVMHAFGPVSQALFRVMGAGMRETVLEDGVDFGDGETEPPPMRAGRSLAASERALEEEGIAWSLVDGGDAHLALENSRVIVVPTSCGLDAPLVESLRAAMAKGAHVTFAPAPPTRDGSFRAMSPKTIRALPKAEVLVGDEAFDVGAIRKHLHASLEGIARVVARPSPCVATVHHDANGRARVVFFVNPTRSRQRLEATIDGVREVRDLIEGTTHVLEAGVAMEAASVRFCEVVG